MGVKKIFKNYRALLIVIITLSTLTASCTFKDNPQTTSSEKTPPEGPIHHDVTEDSLYKAYKATSIVANDTVRTKLLLDISYKALQKGDSLLFLRTNKEARKLSLSLKDSTRLSGAYWDLGKYYYRYHVRDSAYYYLNKAQKIYTGLDDNLNSGRLLLNMAIIQKNIKDYTGSIVTTTNAITILSPLNEYFLLYVANNNLGIVFNELEEYDKALDSHKKALKNLKKSDNTEKLPSVYNNIGVVYKNKKEYPTAGQFFKKALNSTENLRQANPAVYAMILDNQGYAKFHLEDSTGALQQLVEALQIRKKLDLKAGISINQLHLAEYFLYKKDTSKAVKHALTAKKVAAKGQNSRDLLSALKFLSNTASDSALSYSKRYIQINDSINKRERAVRNKFARIRYQTDEYISETERLNRRVVQLTIFGTGGFLILVLMFIIRSQRSKNKFMQQKQKANQEIYNLVLDQQKDIEKGREREKQRISRDLHDGILGRMFGLRLSLDSLNENNDTESKKKRAAYIEEIQKIAQEIRLISHELNKDSLIDVDFKTVLENLIKKQPDTINFQLVLDNSIDWESIGSNLKINIYRIVQEATNNIYKHARATEAKIKITKANNRIVLSIKDNGTGFDTTKKSTHGIGIKNIKDRSRNISGKLLIKSGSEGTAITITVKL